MRTIHIKLWRELWHIRWQGLAICLVMACGVATAVMSLSTLDSLERTRAAYYERQRFANVFVHLKRAPHALLQRVAELPGVSMAEARVVAGVTLDVPGLSEPASGRLISIPDSSPPLLNQLHIRRGRYPDPTRPGEALAAEAFASAHSLAPGDQIRAVINGRLDKLTIVGIALSPEYIYSVRAGELLPDDKRFGVLWMCERELAPAFDLDGAFNNVTLKLLPGASEAEVIRRLDRLLDRYGGTGAHGRADQPSYRFLNNEMIQLRAMASLPPLIFLSVTAFLLHVVLARLIATQREEIATMRAFGYSRRDIGGYYLAFAAVITAIGTAAGLAGGSWLGHDLTVLYARFFRFAEFDYILAPWIVLLAIGVSGTSAVLGIWSAVWRAVSEPPARAMQPEPPPRFRRTIVERLGLGRFLSTATRMIWRHLERQPLRAALSCLGVALAVGILVLGNFTEDTVDYVMDFQFHWVQRQEITVTFVEPTVGRATYDLADLPGMIAVEPFRAVPAKIRFGPAMRRIGVLGLTADRQLFQPRDASGRLMELPSEGIVISEKLAEILGCRIGDQVQVEVLELNRPVREVPVTGVLSDFIELNAYMDIGALHRLMREQDAISGAFLSVDAVHADRLYGKLKETPRISGVAIKRAALESYERTLAENVLRMKAVNVMFASIVAFGVVYNCARISLAERGRELATLRVLGFTRAETAYILFGELGLIVAAAIPIGWGLGYLFAGLLTASLSTEVHRFPLRVSSATYAFAALVVLAASVLSALVVRRRLDRLDMVSVLKARD
jgi:putative ABC transport system permease protein